MQITTRGQTPKKKADRNLRFGWWSLLIFLLFGGTLETMHGFKIGWYLDVGNEVRRLMFTLAHAHGTLLALVNIAAGLTARSVVRFDLRPSTSLALIWAAILLPAGFFLGGVVTYGGDEIDHLSPADRITGNVRDLTPFRGVRAQNVLTDSQHATSLLAALNLRDRNSFDMYRVDLETGAITLEATNPGDVLTWKTDNNFVIRAATAFDGKTGRTIIRVRDGADKPWRDLVVMPFERALFAGEVVNGSLVAGFDPDGKSLLIDSALHSDKGRLVRVDLRDGHELGVVAEDAHADVAYFSGSRLGLEPSVICHPVTNALQAVEFDFTTPHWSFLDPKLKTDFESINREVPGFIELVSRDNGDEKWIVAIQRSDAPGSYYAFDRKTKKLTKMFDSNPDILHFPRAPKKPVVIRARDGLEMVSYLTTPPGVEAKNLPLVLLIHGGPWARDDDSYYPEVQLLANRGYAVLQVNYRGSIGFGVDFFNAGNNQLGRGTQEDLFDAVQWAIEHGIADPKRVAAMGGSMGG